MQYVDMPYVTTSDGISVFDLKGQYRPRLWDDAPGQIDWLYKEDNGLLLTLLELTSPEQGRPMNQPIVHWTEDTRLDIHTQIKTAASSSATTLHLDEARIAVANTFLLFPSDGEIVKVTADPSYTADTVVVTRGYNGTAKSAKTVGQKCISMPAFMAELSDPNGGNGRLPGKPVWNAISIVSESFKVSRLNQGSEVIDGWGQLSKAQLDTMLNLRRQAGKALMFNARGATSTTNEGYEYVSQGMLNYIKSGNLDLGNLLSNLTWPILNDWLEARFDPDASSQTKELISGITLFRNIQRLARDNDRMAVDPYFEPSLKTNVYVIRTDGGYSVNVMLDKYGLGFSEGLGDWGFLLDMAHIEGRHFDGLEFQWIENIQDNRSVMYREDTFIGSFSLIAKHEETHGVIRGAAAPIMSR